MPCASRDELPLQQITPSYSTRMADWGGMTVGIEAGRGHGRLDVAERPP